MAVGRWGRLGSLALIVSLALAIAGCGGSGGGQAGGDKSWSKPPEMALKADKTYEALFDTTEGAFKVKLFQDTAPNTVNSFVFLSREGFYENVIFHRIMKTFMIQTGDPTGTGMGGPGYRLQDELKSPHKYDVGILAMANAGPNTAGSQFFICTGEECGRSLNPNPNYTIFGQVIEGMDVVQKIAATPVRANPNARNEMSLPTREVKINKIDIVEK